LGDDGPVTANRRQVFCRASQVSVATQPKSQQGGGFIHEQFEAQLLASFRSLPLDQTVVRIQSELDQHGWSNDIRFRLRFLLAFAYHELGRSQLGIEMVRDLVCEARTDGEMMIAKHALGGLLWHEGHFKQGIETLWEAASLAKDQPSEQVHILSNIAIGAYEARSKEELRYTESVAAQKLRFGFESDHSIVLDYVRGLAFLSEYRYSEASQLFEVALIESSATSHRMSVYLLEANAASKLGLSQEEDAKSLLNQAKAMRKAFNMHPSTVELRRLQKLRASMR
jgi:tetratricopeptide (TPR) repeat protein